MKSSSFSFGFKRREGAGADKPAADRPGKAEDVARNEVQSAKAETTPAGAPDPKPEPAARESPAPDVAPAAALAVGARVARAPSRVSRLVEAAAPKSLTRRIDVASLRESVRRAGPAVVPASACAALILSLGIGYGIGRAQHGHAAVMSDALAQLATATAEMRRASNDVRAMTTALEAATAERPPKGGETGGARQAQILDRVEKATQDQGARIARLADQLDRLEKAPREPGRGPSLADRLERIEKSLAAMLPPPAMPAPNVQAPAAQPRQAGAREGAAADVSQTGAIPDKPAKHETDPRKTQIDGFFVRDVDSGFALIETRAGRYIDVAVGYVVPGVGRVESIERRGRQWVVVTAKGFIGER